MAVNVKLGVDLSAFTSGIREGQSIMKGLNAEMKATEAEFKATGNAEQMLASKTKTLNSQIQVQKGIANQAAQALKAMTEAGIDPADAAYQKLYATMMNATAGMNNAQAELNALGTSAQGASTSADQLTTSIQNIGKKISLDQVISGIDSITNGLERAGKKALEVGKDIWNNIMDSARMSDDIATQAKWFEMTPEQYQRYTGVFDTIGEITVQEWDSARRKIEKAIENPSNEQIDVLKALGFGGMTGGKGSVTEENVKLTADNWEDAFWDVATEIKRRVDSGEISGVTADVWGEAMFGKKYAHMKTLIDMGKDAFTQALGEIDVTSDDAIEKNAALNDAVIDLQNSYKALERQLASGIAPALTDATKALDGMLGKILEYLKTEEGQEMLQDLGTAVSGLFDDLGKIDPEAVVSGFTGVITSVTDGIQWLVDNAETVKGILGTIVGAWALSNVAVAGLEITKLIQGLTGLAGAGAAEGAAAAGAAAGASWGGAFAAAVAAAAPWLVGLYTMLNPSETAGNNQDLLWANGQLTQEGVNWWNNNMDIWNARTLAVGNRYGSLSTILGDQEALDIMLNPTISDEEVFKQLEEKLGMKPLDIPYDLITTTTAEDLASAVGTVQIPAVLVYDGSSHGAGGLGGAVLEQRANGWSYVPYDGMLVSLHKGERVMPAREVQSRSYNSNLYVESMIMNNGADAAGLASAMAAAQRRQMNGFGS